METYEVVRRVLSWGPQYDVRALEGAGGGKPLWGIKVGFLSKISMVQGDDGPEVAKVSTNFARTKYECLDGKGNVVATLAFPVLALKKTFTITVGERAYKADGGFMGGEFTCKDDGGRVVMTIAKQLSLRDKFKVSIEPASFPREIALVCAAVIDQRFFQE